MKDRNRKSQRREEEKRGSKERKPEKVRRKKMQGVGKGREVAKHHVFFHDLRLWKVKKQAY